MEDTIVALSTPNGVGGIAVVRMSGESAYNIMRKVFSCKADTISPRYAYLGKFHGTNIDETCIMIYFKSPFSYTGEDVVEFQCHGGNVVAYEIINTLLQSGCRMATAGEFTKRAYLNGKLSLDEAEGVIDMINADSTAEVRAGYELSKGSLSKVISSMQDSLTDSLATINVVIDYPEEGVEEDANIDIKDCIVGVLNNIDELISSSKSGMIIKNGMRIALVGKPNVGKSSLFNKLLEYDRAIVTDIKGTTRDTLDAMYTYKGVKFVIIDTAGVQDTKDMVERIGIDRSLEAIDSCDLVLFLVDGQEKLTKEDYDIYNKIIDKKYIIIVNKTEDNVKCDYTNLEGEKLEISTVTDKNISKLKDRIYNFAMQNISTNSVTITNIRHVQILRDAHEIANNILELINSGVTHDILSIEITKLWNKLGEITGNTNNQDIIDKIFDKFCVGK